jgi:membrane protease YdiL (CAAX protease family)
VPDRRYWRISALVAVSGLPLGLVEYLVLRPGPIVEEYTAGGFLLAFIILLIGTGLIEELVFRGILQSTATSVLGRWPGIVFVSLVFGVLHVGHLSALDVVFVFGVALYFAEVVRRTRSLFAVTIAHGLTNFMLFVMLPTIGGM